MDLSAFWRDGLPPQLVWGLVPRLVGALYAIAFASLASQVLGLVGQTGISPVSERLRRLREDYPGPRRFFRVPTLLWLSSHDATLRVLPWLGVASGLWTVWGGETQWSLFACWVLYLSLDVCALVFPWDCLLFEAGFLALFLPNAPAWSSGIAATTLPLPVVTLLWRILIIRLMWGFAKLKFVGTKRGDSLYLRGFFVWMPMCTPLGWLAHHAPRWALRAAYAFMWCVEVLAPLLACASGTPRVVAAVALMTLMTGIALTGNWGFFNLGYGLLTIVLLDAHSTLADLESWQQLWGTPSTAATHAVLAVVAFGALLHFPFNSWCTHTWLHWAFEDLTYRRPWLDRLIRMYRFLAPFRLVAAYGVFPANSSPALKLVPVFQGSADGHIWRDFRFRYMPSQERSRPPWVAPHHPRLDHSLVYAGAGLTDSNYLASVMGAGIPYGYASFSHASWLHRTAQRLLEGSPSVRGLLAADNPFSEHPPRYVRVITQALTPASLAERRKTGRWWHRRPAATLLPSTALDSSVWQRWLPPPECFHPDHVHWRKSSPALLKMVRAYEHGTPHAEAVRVESPLLAQDVASFWTELIPQLNQWDRHDWSCLETTVADVQERFGPLCLSSFERILERYAFLLRTRLEPHMYGKMEPRLQLRSNFRFHLLLHEIILGGRSALERTLEDPAWAVVLSGQQTAKSALYASAIFHYETLRYQSAALQLVTRVTNSLARPIPGILEFRTQLVARRQRGELWLPTFHQTPKGEWLSLDESAGEHSPCTKLPCSPTAKGRPEAP